MALTSWDMMELNTFSIWDSIKARNPRLNMCLTYEQFKDEFEVIAYKNESEVKPLLIGNKKNKVKINALKLKAPIWRPNAIYGNRPNGTSQDRVIMGSGLYAFDIDFKEYWNFKEHQEKLEGYKETLFRDVPNIFAVYKSFTMSGLHVIVKGVSVKDNKSYRQMWETERRELKKHFRFVKIDEKAKDITRALFIGSDSNPLIRYNYEFIPPLQDISKLKEMVNEKIVELPADIDIAFAKIQNVIKPSFIENTNKRFVRFFVNYNDLEDVFQKKWKKFFSENIELKTGEDYHLESYIIDSTLPIYLPKMYIADGFIPIGRRRSTLVSILSKFIYLNGYWLCDAKQLVKTHFDKYYFEKFEQRKGEQFTKEEMYSVIDSVLKDKLLPHSVDAITMKEGKKNTKQNFDKKTVFVDTESGYSSNHKSILARRHQLNMKIRRCYEIANACYIVYGKDINLKEMYYKGENLWRINGMTSESSFRQFIYRNDIDLTYLNIINTLSRTKNIYIDKLNDNSKSALSVSPKTKDKRDNV